MKIFLNVIGALLTLIGTVWLLHGIGILPGSFMSGQTKWAVNGAITAAIGIAILLAANTLLKKRHKL
jgi:hypothetical protein